MSLINKSQINRNTRKFTDKDTQFKFLLGGIGTGSISIGSRGELCDWEIFNKPNKQMVAYPYSFFSIYSRFDGEESQVRMLESAFHKPYGIHRPDGYLSNEVAGVPRFEKAELQGRGPFVNVRLKSKDLPLKVELEAFSPLIPTEEDESGIPAIFFQYTVKNISNKSCEVAVCATQSNYTSMVGLDKFNNPIINKKQRNETFNEDGLTGVLFSSDESPENRNYGTMCIATPDKNVTVKSQWADGGWWDGAQDFFNDFCDDGMLDSEQQLTASDSPLEGVAALKTASISSKTTLLPGQTQKFTFFLSWSFPNRPKSWEGHICPARDFGDEIIKNYYSYRFPTAISATKYFYNNFASLFAKSKLFADALLSTSFDKWVVDAINATLSVLRSTTCFRVGEEGTFLAWEGCFETSGSCEGNCTHVWNYAQMLAYLFPRLEQSMRRTEFLLETDEDGNMAFRSMQPLGDKRWEMLPATDGQLGCVIRLYRDWKYSGNDQLLKDCYSNMKKALDFAFTYWDSNGDNVLDSRQHNTYDIEFYGENSLTNSVFFAALKAGSKMAEYMGDIESAKKWKHAFESGSVKADSLLFNGEYYVQAIDDVDKYKYQYGAGCLSDQIFGQTLAHLNGLGYVLPMEHVRSSALSIYKYNFKRDLGKHFNVQRAYALNDDSGLVLCSWPNNTKRPRFPFVYSDEVWTGIEYQVATELIYEGYVEEALDVVKAVRMRYDGVKRNPFNEIECGNHYARSLASYGLMVALSGYECDMVNKTITFKRAKDEKYVTFFVTPNCFGLCEVGKDNYLVDVLFGNLDGIKINLI